MKKAPTPSSAPQVQAESNDVSALIETLTALEAWLMKSGLEEIEVGRDGRHMRLKKPGSGPVVAAAVAAPAVAAPAAVPEPANAFKAPLVGTFYAASSPEAAPFVQVGTVVKEGQVLGIIEAMKTMNQLTADCAGTVKQVLVKNGQPVEFGQPLFVIG